eukprot:531285_1
MLISSNHIHPLWIKVENLPDEMDTQQIINSNISHEFILISSELSSFNSYTYNTHTKSLKPFVTNQDFECFHSIKVAYDNYDSKKQILYILYGTNIYSVDVTTNTWNKFQHETINEFGNYFLFVNNQLHIIKNREIHWITSIKNNRLKIISEPWMDEFTLRHTREDAAAIFISSKQCILLIGGYSSDNYNLRDIWMYSLKRYKWTQINISFDRYDFGYVLTSNQQHIIFFGGWKYNVWRNKHVQLNDIFVLNI